MWRVVVGVWVQLSAQERLLPVRLPMDLMGRHLVNKVNRSNMPTGKRQADAFRLLEDTELDFSHVRPPTYACVDDNRQQHQQHRL